MRKTMDISLRSVADIKNFANLAEGMDGEVTLSSGRYCVDAKSILGIYALDLSSPIYLEVEKWKDEYEAAMEQFRV